MSQIIKAPAEVLRTPTKPVEKLDKKVLAVISDMRKTLLAQKDPEGVGLAAPQIGVPLRIFFVRPPPQSSRRNEPELFINPEIISLSRDTTNPKGKHSILEGCLSLPGYYGRVNRSKSVTVKYQDLGPSSPERLITKNKTFTGFTAQIIQHEFDHLVGTLFVDRILEQNGKLYEITGDNWKEVSL